MNWVRLWQDMPTDPKWRVVAKRSGRPLSEVLAVFVHMLTNAGANATERGVLERWCHDDIAAALDMEPEHVEAIYDAMQGKTLQGDALTGWEKRQPKREDGSAERAKAWRERNRTQANAEKRPDTETDTDTDTEKNNTPLPPTGDEPEPAKFIRDRSSGLAVTRAYEAYCQAAIRSNTPLPIGLSPELRRSIGARLKDSGQEAWGKAIANMEASDFLRGLNGDGGFICNIHWFAKPSNFAKVLSGCYANRQAKGKGGQVVDMQALLADVRAKYGAQNAQGV
jgi:hypothetical protein